MMTRTAYRLIVLLASALCFSGCAHRTPTPPPQGSQVPWLEQVRLATQLTDWQLQGKIGVKSGREGGSAFVNWLQMADSFHITLSGPLGQGATIISGNDQGARLESARNGTHIAESAEQLLFDHTGWYIPLSHLLHWIKGLPDPALPHQETRTPEGLIESLIQGPWTLRFDRYAQLENGPYLPHRLRIDSQAWSVTLLVRRWGHLQPEAWHAEADQ